MAANTIGKIEISFGSKLVYTIFGNDGNVIQSEESVSTSNDPEEIVSELLEEINEHIKYNDNGGLIWEEF